MNERALRVLEFNKIREQLALFAQSDLGREKCLSLTPMSGKEEVVRALEETEEAGVVLKYMGVNPMMPFSDISLQVDMARKGATLTPGALMKIAETLKVAGSVRSALVTDRENTPSVTSQASLLQPLRALRESIDETVLGENEISDRASPELADIRRHIRLCNERVRDKLNAYAHGSGTSKYLMDNIVTIRNGRYVLAVKQEYRQFVPGLVHDQSSTGATLYIEPMAVVELGNEIKGWQAKEKAEIERILLALSGQAAENASQLLGNLEVLAELDFVFAKASLAKDMEAVCPKVSVDGQVRFIRARHPLIDRQTVVPLDFWIGDGFRTLVITGPNTGGKTVTLKTIGLLTLMAQSGLHIPAAYGSQIALFKEVYADIGDEQSIEQSLSTFSAHMTNIVTILRTVTDRDLVLFDELGAGTDPTEGAALAQAILSHLTQKGITAIATTHYSELKAYALSTKGVENASVEFDVNTLRPTYRLSIGVPGKSNAFEISRKLGLSEEMINDAKELLNHDAIKFEDVIANAEYHRQIAEKEQALAEEARRETVRMKNETERLFREAEEMERTADRKAREKARAIVEKARLDAEKILNDMKRLKQQASQGDMGQLVRQLDRMSDQFSDGLESARHLPETEDREIREGDTVLVTTLNAQGTVLSLSDDSAQVQIGVMKMNCSRKDLVFIKSGQKVQKKVSVTARVDSQSRQVSLSCDLRGLSLEEALSKADQYLDEAYLAGLHEVTLVHGKGTGVLRQGITRHLKKHAHVKSHRLGVYGEGEDGVTVVTLA